MVRLCNSAGLKRDEIKHMRPPVKVTCAVQRNNIGLTCDEIKGGRPPGTRGTQWPLIPAKATRAPGSRGASPFDFVRIFFP